MTHWVLSSLRSKNRFVTKLLLFRGCSLCAGNSLISQSSFLELLFHLTSYNDNNEEKLPCVTRKWRQKLFFGYGCTELYCSYNNTLSPHCAKLENLVIECGGKWKWNYHVTKDWSISGSRKGWVMIEEKSELCSTIKAVEVK